MPDPGPTPLPGLVPLLAALTWARARPSAGSKGITEDEMDGGGRTELEIFGDVISVIVILQCRALPQS